jgi:hypothetical protein
VVVDSVDAQTRLSIMKFITDILPDIEEMSSVEQIFSRVQDMLSKNPELRGKINNEFKPLVLKHTDELGKSPVYNDTSMLMKNISEQKKVGIVVTEESAYNNPAFAKSMESVAAAKGTLALTYGDIFKTEEDARKFVEATGCKANFKFINQTLDGRKLTMEELEAQIAENYLEDGIAIDEVGIVTAPGEIDGKPSDMTVMELKNHILNGKNVLLAMNAEKALYRVLQLKGAVAIDKILLGLIYDPNTKRYTYLPPMVSEDAAEEAQAFMTSMLMLCAAV